MGAKTAAAMPGKKRQGCPNALKWAQVALRLVQVGEEGVDQLESAEYMADGCGIGRRVCPARNTDHYPFDKSPPGQVLFMLMMLGGAAHVVAVGGSPSL
jgi:hypothetical protein